MLMRQTKRMIFMEVFSLSAFIMPYIVTSYGGRNGIFVLMIGLLLLLFFGVYFSFKYQSAINKLPTGYFSKNPLIDPLPAALWSCVRATTIIVCPIFSRSDNDFQEVSFAIGDFSAVDVAVSFLAVSLLASVRLHDVPSIRPHKSDK